MAVDAELVAAIEKIHTPAGWVHLATIGRYGSPHVAPMMMGLGDGVLLFSLTGKQKKRNLERDPRATVSLAEAGTLAHVIVWGSIEMRHDAEAQVTLGGDDQGRFRRLGVRRPEAPVKPGRHEPWA